MTKLLVLADDFTGALDTGVQFSSRGIPTLVTVNDDINFGSIISQMCDLSASKESECISASDDAPVFGESDSNHSDNQETQVFIMDMESRHVPAETAAGKVHNIVKQALRSGVEYFYKKTDSTLRGNIGAELTALLNTVGSRCLVFVPAYPKAGRTTENGCQLVNGIPLQHTSFAKDPLNPINESYIPAIVKNQSNCKVVLLRLSNDNITVIDEAVSKNIDISKDDFNDLLDSLSEPSIIVFDASTDQDLQEIGNLIKKAGASYTTAGCAGFAAVLQDLLNFKSIRDEMWSKKIARTKPEEDHPHKKATLIICGSLNETSLKQVKHAEDEGWYSAAFSPEILLKNSENPSRIFEAAKSILSEIISVLQLNGKAIIKTVADAGKLNSYIQYGESLGLDKDEIHLRIARNMGMLIKCISAQADIDAYVVFGGDTAFGIMKAMEWDGLIPRDEILPGVAISQIIHRIPEASSFNVKNDGSKSKNTIESSCKYLVTKAGGFGDQDVLIHIEKYLKETGGFA